MIEKYTHKGFTFVISEDDEPENPREWENVGVMVCFHGRYNLGDTKHGLSLEDAQALEAGIDDAGGLGLPLYLYDHGGLAISHESFIGRAPHAEWDSGQIGLIYCDAEKLKAEFDGDREKAKACLISEVKAYDQYLRGEVYEFDVKAKDGESSIEFCGGYYDPADAKRDAENAIDILAAASA